MKTKEKKKAKDIYTAVLTVLGKTYRASGDTVPEAITKLTPSNPKGRCILSVEHGNKKRERILPHLMSFKLFSSSRMMREIALKQVSSLFDV